MQGDRMALLRILMLVSVVTFSVTIQAQDDPRLSDSREIVEDFAGRLQTALQSAMSSGGPANAIGVCKYVAPDDIARGYAAGDIRGAFSIVWPASKNRPTAPQAKAR